jgi:hypothetical protein
MPEQELESVSQRSGAFTRAFTFLLLLGTVSVCDAGDLKPFTTDGCSAFPDGTPVNRTAWLNCCIRHDMAYWKGGTHGERKDADRALESCVANIGEPEIAKLMRTGVRAGGSPYWPTPFRWGYGWPYLRGYKALSSEEQVEVQQRLDEFQLLLRGVTDQIGASKK